MKTNVNPNDKITRLLDELGISAKKAAELINMPYSAFNAKKKQFNYNCFSDKNYEDLVMAIKKIVETI